MTTKKLSTGRSPNFILSMPLQITHRGSSVTLPYGTFIRPINDEYVPRHVFDKPENKWYNSETHLFAYTWFGIIQIPKDAVKES